MNLEYFIKNSATLNVEDEYYFQKLYEKMHDFIKIEKYYGISMLANEYPTMDTFPLVKNGCYHCISYITSITKDAKIYFIVLNKIILPMIFITCVHLRETYFQIL